jgi:hypothetical protein
MTTKSTTAELSGQTGIAPKDALKTPARQAYEILHWGFVAVPAITGIDKFLHILTDWDHYLAPQLARLSPLGVHQTMMVVGVIEMVAGLIVALRPRVGAWIVALWLAGIIFDLALLGNAWDVALRDLGLLASAIAFARLAVAHDRHDIA